MTGAAENNGIFAIVSAIIKDITGNPGLTIGPDHKAGDIRNWDSLHHVMIISEIEQRFGIRFDLPEMLEISTVDDICRAVSRKQVQG